MNRGYLASISDALPLLTCGWTFSFFSLASVSLVSLANVWWKFFEILRPFKLDEEKKEKIQPQVIDVKLLPNFLPHVF